MVSDICVESGAELDAEVDARAHIFERGEDDALCGLSFFRAAECLEIVDFEPGSSDSEYPICSECEAAYGAGARDRFVQACASGFAAGLSVLDMRFALARAYHSYFDKADSEG